MCLASETKPLHHGFLAVNGSVGCAPRGGTPRKEQPSVRMKAALGRQLARASAPLAISMVSQADVATAVGYALGAGSTCLYSPMIVRCLSRRSADGLSAETWLFKLTAYFTSDLYCFSRHYPLSQYAESLTLAVQALVMLSIVCRFQQRASPLLAALAVLLGGAALLAAPSVEDAVLPGLQTVAAVLGAGAVLPQIILNFRQSGSGEFSVITATLLTTGNLLRGWTTTKLAGGDPVLLLGACLGFFVNGALLSQVLYYATKEGMSLRALYLSDFAHLFEVEGRGPLDTLPLLRKAVQEADDDRAPASDEDASETPI